MEKAKAKEAKKADESSKKDQAKDAAKAAIDKAAATKEKAKVDKKLFEGVDSFYVDASKEINSLKGDDHPVCQQVKKSALEELAKSLQAKAQFHISESEEANEDLKEIQALIKANDEALKKAEQDEAAKEAKDAADA